MELNFVLLFVGDSTIAFVREWRIGRRIMAAAVLQLTVQPSWRQPA
jgi:hypothetical protein